jgi:outer membrane protein with beta-barrel domain
MMPETLSLLRHLAVAAALVAAGASAALAQEPDPLPKVALDVQAATPKFPRDPNVATSLGVTTDNMPGRGLGVAVGLHVYPARLGKVTLGLGAQFLVSRARNTLEPTTSGGAEGPTVEARYSALSPQMSLNFGGPSGWSYVSGGIGWATFTIERTTTPVTEPDGRMRTLHYGGGARWFAKKHLAFSFDLRFHRYPAQSAITGRPAYPKGRMLVASAGISVK